GPHVRVSHLRVDESHGDAYTTWAAQGMPASPSAAEVAALQQAMEPAALAPDQTLAVGADGSLGVDFDLPRFGVSLVTLTPAGAISPPGKGGGGCGCRVCARGDEASALFTLGTLLAIACRRRRAQKLF